MSASKHWWGASATLPRSLRNTSQKYLNAQDRSLELEEEIFLNLRDKLLQVIGRIQKTAEGIAISDVISSLAELSVTNNYIQPAVTESDLIIRIVEGRHPVVESFVSE